LSFMGAVSGSAIGNQLTVLGKRSLNSSLAVAER
jgi:hypothetical protein